jgi:hypothetical protein
MADVSNFTAFSRPPTRFTGALQLLYNHVIVLSELLLNLLIYCHVMQLKSWGEIVYSIQYLILTEPPAT